MNIDSLNDLKKLVKLCRTLGVKQMKLGELSFEMSDYEPEITPRSRGRDLSKDLAEPIYVPGGIDASTKIDTDTLTDEQLLMWSADSVE